MTFLGLDPLLALAKQLEESIIGILEISWKQVKQAMRHLQSARDQVIEVELDLITA